MSNTIGNGSPPRRILPDVPYELADVEGARPVVIDRTAIPSNELATIIAGGDLLGRVERPMHPLVREGIDSKETVFDREMASAGVTLAGLIAMLIGVASGPMTVALYGSGVAVVGLFSLIATTGGDDSRVISKNYEKVLTAGFSPRQWRYLLKRMTDGCDESQFEAGLKTAGVTWKQLRNIVRPTREDGDPLTARDVGMLFAELKGEAAGDYVALAYATRNLGPLKFSKKNRTGPSEYFVALTQDMTGRAQPDVTVENPTETSTLFCRMMGDIAYTTDAVSIPQFVLMGAHLMKYHTNALGGTEVADHMLGSVKAYLRGDLNKAYKKQVAALEELEKRDETIEGVAVSALHHLSMAELIAERVQGMIDEGSKPYDTLIRQATIHAETAIDGLSLVQGTGYVNKVPGMSMLMGRVNTVLNAMRDLR